MLLLPNNWFSNQLLPGVVVHTQQWVANGSRFLWVQSQPALHSEIQDSQGYTETLSTTTRSQFFHPEIFSPSSILSKVPDRWIVFYLTSISTLPSQMLREDCPGKSYVIQNTFDKYLVENGGKTIPRNSCTAGVTGFNWWRGNARIYLERLNAVPAIWGCIQNSRA